MNYDYCIYDRFEQCFHDCKNCPKADKPEPDWDFMHDIMRGDELIND
ncbi:MAG: hypothetical protein ACI4I9_09845 [Porcipelethomonas sp.]